MSVDPANPGTGVVVIGRNEGERLRRCLVSLKKAYEGTGARIVYVDSGSTDGSRELARELGAEIVDLDLSTPFTAARARNAGVARLRQIMPALGFVQFIDGDCELAPGWPGIAMQAITAQGDIAVVCGRRREIHPDRSIYNRLCDMEWNTPIGEAAACGGDSLMRASAFESVAGFRDDVIAGEEPELCFRLRRAGWRILRIDHDMTRHDAAIERFGQWWKRAKRGGHACAEAIALHFKDGERSEAKRALSILAYSLGVPIVAIAAVCAIGPIGLVILTCYAVPIFRSRNFRIRERKDTASDAMLYAIFMLLGKFAELAGIALYGFRRIARSQKKIIEYK